MFNLIKNEDEYKKTIKYLSEKNDIIRSNPIINQYLQDKEHVHHFNNVIDNPTIENMQLLDDSFAKFYKELRTVKYLSGLVRQYSIDYDKRVRKRNTRYQLIINSPIERNNNDSLIDRLTVATPKFNLIDNPENQLINTLTNQELYLAVKSLKIKQINILELYYVQGYNNREIAEIFGQTEQNISYWHKKTLNQLREILTN